MRYVYIVNHSTHGKEKIFKNRVHMNATMCNVLGHPYIGLSGGVLTQNIDASRPELRMRP